MAAKQKPTPRRAKGPQQIYTAVTRARYIKEWTTSIIDQARLQADYGEFWLVGDLFDNLLQRDAHHPGTLNAISEKVLSYKTCFNQDKNEDDTTPDEAALESDYASLAPREELFSLLARGMSLGFCVVQLTPWTASADGRMLPSFHVWPTQNTRYDREKNKWYARTSQDEIEIITGDGQWAIFLPYGQDRPWLQGTWRACADWVKSKIDARLDWDRQGETAAGIKTVETPEGASSEDRRKAASDLSQIGADGVFVPPPEWKMNLFQSSTATYQTFEKKIETANKEISVANKGESHTAGSGGGGLAEGAGVTRKEVSDTKSEFFASALERFLNEQVIPTWQMLNLPSADPVRIEIETDSEEEISELLASWDKAADVLVKLTSIGVQIDVVALAKKIGLPVKEGSPPPAKQTGLAPAMPAQGATTPTNAPAE